MREQQIEKLDSENELAQEIISILLKYANFSVLTNDSKKKINPVHISKLEKAIEKNKAIEFILPAFPAKSANRQKTYNNLPDYGEVIGLAQLQKFCDEIAEIYIPGATVKICSDGRVFNDLVLVEEDNVMKYQEEVRAIISQFRFRNLSTFHLEEAYSNNDFNYIREQLLREFARPLSQIRYEVKIDPKMQTMFNGLHRFLLEDRLDLITDKSKNKIREETKEITYALIQRSNAWSTLVEKLFPEAVRLSIHPQLENSTKIGFRLVPGGNAWATPWHGVVCKTKNGFQLMKRREVESLQTKIQFFQNKYAFYEICEE